MFYSIDRIVGRIAVLTSDKDGSQVLKNREYLPENAEEGSILIYKDGEYIYDAEETARRRKEFFLRTKNLSKK